MKVYQNIENYDPAEVVHLDVEGDEKFIADLKKAVGELEKRINNKRLTRQYFDEALNIDAHIEFNNALNEYFYNSSEEGGEYVPAQGEFRWFGRFFHPALLKVLEDDKYAFGYSYNLLLKAEAERTGERLNERDLISDNAIKYAQMFDISRILLALSNKKTPEEKLEFLNAVKLQNDLNADLYIWERESLEEKFEYQLEKIIDSVKEEIKNRHICDKSDTNNDDRGNTDDVKIRGAQIQVLPPEDDPYCVPEPTDVFYNPEYITNGRFSPLELRMDFDFEYRQSYNSKALAQIIEKSFSECYLNQKELLWNEENKQRINSLLSHLFDDYEKRITEIQSDNWRDYVKSINNWVIETIQIVDKAYEKNKRVQYHYEVDEITGTQFLGEADTFEYKLFLYQCIIGAVFCGNTSIVIETPVELKDVIFYNFWGDDLGKKSELLRGRVGLAEEERSMVFPPVNINFFKKNILETYDIYQQNQIAVIPTFGAKEGDAQSYDIMETFFQYRFSNYIKRISSHVNDKSIIDQAVISWLTSTISFITDYYYEVKESIHADGEREDENYIICNTFFARCCIFKLVEKLKHYYDDTDAVGFLTNSNPIAICQDDIKEKEQVKSHLCEIDYEGLYGQWNNIAFKNISLEEFKYAIDKPDFDNMMQKAKDIGNKSGYMGGTLFMIRYLSTSLKKKWYQDACATIGKTTNEVDKVHGDTKKAKQIAAVTLDQYIK